MHRAPAQATRLLDVEGAGALAAGAPLHAVPHQHVHQPLVVLAPHHLNVAGQHVALRALDGRVQEERLRRGWQQGGGG